MHGQRDLSTGKMNKRRNVKEGAAKKYESTMREMLAIGMVKEREHERRGPSTY